MPELPLERGIEMFEINSNKTFRQGYEMLSILNNPKFQAQHHYKDDLNEYIATFKRELRKWAHRETAVDVGMGFMVERRIVKEDGIDGYVELVSIPDVFDTEEAADAFFKDFLYISCRPSMYDCTGQAFTSWYKLFKRRGQFYAYHRIALDV